MKRKTLLIALVGILVLIQFFTIDKTNPESNNADDILFITNASDEISSVLKESCYDCHSNKTKYPWYSNVAPISWAVQNHVVEGREHLNFSEWGSYSEEKKISIAEECAEEIEENEMPLKGYTIIHSGSDLTVSEKEMLIEWFKQLK